MTVTSVHVYPSPMVNESRLQRIGQELVKRGVVDRVLLVGLAGDGLPMDESVAPGVSIRRIAPSHATRRRFRKLDRLRWEVRTFRAVVQESPRVVAAHSVWMLPLCWLVARRAKAKLVYNAHELETRTPTMTGLKGVLAKAIERTFIGRCQLVSVVNASIADWYESSYDISRPVVTYNVPLVSDERAGLREQLGIAESRRLFIHTGRPAGGRSIPQLLSHFAERPELALVFLGDGPLRTEVQAAAEANSNIHWLPPVEPHLVVSYVREADVALCLIDTASLSYRLSSPNKLFEALAAGTPVLCSDLVEARRFLGPLSDSWVIRDVETQLGEAIDQLTDAQLEEFRQTLEPLPSWESAADELANAYRRLVS